MFMHLQNTPYFSDSDVYRFGSYDECIDQMLTYDNRLKEKYRPVF